MTVISSTTSCTRADCQYHKHAKKTQQTEGRCHTEALAHTQALAHRNRAGPEDDQQLLRLRTGQYMSRHLTRGVQAWREGQSVARAGGEHAGGGVWVDERGPGAVRRAERVAQRADAPDQARLAAARRRAPPRQV